MPTYALRINGQHVGYITGELGEHCRGCCAPADNLCDYPVGDDKTCDRPICNEHSRRVGADIHYCATHARQWDKWRRDGGVRKTLKNVIPFEAQRSGDT